MKKSGLFVLYIFVAIVMFYSCQSPQASDKTGEMEKLSYQIKAIDVKAVIVERGAFYKEIVSNGKLCPVEKAKLVFKINENISMVNVNNGQKVRQGQLLVQLDSYYQKLSLEKANNQLQKSEIELKNILLAHNPDLADTANINSQVLKTARGRSGYNDALFSVREAEYNLSQTNINAPFDGIISDIQVKENNYSGNYEFFAYVLDSRQMEVEFGIMESELEMISLNAEVIISPYAFSNKKFSGKISEINPTIDQSGMIKVKAVILNNGGFLLDGMNAEVVIRKEVSGQFIVPKEAVLLRQKRQMLFVLKNDSIAQWVYVKTGLENTSQYTIIDGINEGDTIIISNNFNLGHEVIVNAQIITR
jgi:RND family efflux transporter MFP subunit